MLKRETTQFHWINRTKTIQGDDIETVLKALEEAREEAWRTADKTGKSVSIVIKCKVGKLTYKKATINVHCRGF